MVWNQDHQVGWIVGVSLHLGFFPDFIHPFLAIHLLYDHLTSPYTPKICQSDLGTYILELYGTDGSHLLGLGFDGF